MWTATPQLRWIERLKRGANQRVLQQKWTRIKMGEPLATDPEEEWRDVPVVGSNTP